MSDRTTAEVLPTDTPRLFEIAVKRAAKLLLAGQAVALPTETVYGLAANALDEAAVRRIFEIKGRPAGNPIIVHVASLEMARNCAAHWPASAAKLARAFWPGPLTMVLPRAARIPAVVAAGGNTVGLRWPSHAFIQAVIQCCGFPLAAPSANLSNRISPTTAGHVLKDLGGRIPLIVDGGPSHIGIESTVLDVSVEPPHVLRPGMVHEEVLLAVVGALADGDGPGSGPLKSPGQMPRHYSPRARLAIFGWENEAELLVRTAAFGVENAKIHVIAHSQIPSGRAFAGVSVMPHDAEAYARALYAELHRCDDAGAELIIAEALPKTAEWRGLADRLRRASQE